MARLINDKRTPYLLRSRIEMISSGQKKQDILDKISHIFDKNRKYHILNDITDDLTFTESRILCEIIGCSASQLADHTFDLNSVVTGVPSEPLPELTFQIQDNLGQARMLAEKLIRLQVRIPKNQLSWFRLATQNVLAAICNAKEQVEILRSQGVS